MELSLISGLSNVDINNITIRNCTLDGYTTWPLYLTGDVGDVMMYGNTFTAGVGPNYILTNGSFDAMGDFLFYDNTADVNNGIYFSATPMTSKGNAVYIRDNTITCSADNPTYLLSIGSNNTPDETATNVSDLMSNILIAGNTVTQTGSSSCHSLLIGGDVVGASVLDNYFDNNGDNFGLVCKGKSCHIRGNISIGDNCLYMSGGQSCLVEENVFHATAGYGIFWSTNSGYGTARNPTNNVYENNIVIADDSASACVQDSGLGDMYGQTFNYNCYYNNHSSVVFTFNSSNYSSIAALPAGWIDAAGIKNDANSIVSDPHFRDLDNNDYRLKPESPCINAGERTQSSGYKSMGVWQPCAIKPLEAPKTNCSLKTMYGN
jgi:hypothetical protein